MPGCQAIGMLNNFPNLAVGTHIPVLSSRLDGAAYETVPWNAAQDRDAVVRNRLLPGVCSAFSGSRRGGRGCRACTARCTRFRRRSCGDAGAEPGDKTAGQTSRAASVRRHGAQSKAVSVRRRHAHRHLDDSGYREDGGKTRLPCNFHRLSQCGSGRSALQRVRRRRLAGSKTPRPNVTRMKSVIGHSVFGFGMYAAARAIAEVWPAP